MANGDNKFIKIPYHTGANRERQIAFADAHSHSHCIHSVDSFVLFSHIIPSSKGLPIPTKNLVIVLGIRILLLRFTFLLVCCVDRSIISVLCKFLFDLAFFTAKYTI